MKFYNPDEYQPKAWEVYRLLKPKIEKCMPVAKVEHVGSSSVPGMISKGDLDIYLEVPKEYFNKAITKLNHMGFYEKEGTLQNNELRMMVSKEYDLDVAIQVVSKDSKYKFFRDFRDILKKNRRVRDQYNQLKIRCESCGEDEYTRIKSIFIEKILEGGR